ncbi:MAG: hypothetical protein ABIG39_07300 [Candidatus Micrarchaeota archaeon]
MEEIEKAFSDTTKIVLGVELKNLDDYGEWLSRRVPIPTKGKSAVSGKDVWIQPSLCFLKQPFDKDRIIDMGEIGKVNESPFIAEDLKDTDLRNVLKILKPVVYYCGNLRYKNVNNLEKTSSAGEVVNVYYSEDIWYGSKKVAFSNMVVFSESMFGSHNVHYSKFCINTYNSFRISRGLEIDGCTNCSDVFFCHNSENLRDCILCFNTKSLRYAVGNVEVGKDEYLRISRMLKEHILERLEVNHNFEQDIFNIACRGISE